MDLSDSGWSDGESTTQWCDKLPSTVQVRPEEPPGWLDSFRFEPEPPWSRGIGFVHVLIVVAAAGFVSTIGALIGFVIDFSTSDDDVLGLIMSEDFDAGVPSMIRVLPATLVIGTIFQQLGQGLSPLLISKWWRGYGAIKDWGLRFKWVDIPLGVGLAAAGFALAWLVSISLSPLLGVSEAEADNGVVISGFKGSVWLYPIIFAVVIGAPLSEEIAFRGLLQRSLSRFGGPLVGIFGSTLLFALVHIGGTSFNGQIVLWASIFMIGLVFAVASAYFKRLGPSIIGHVLNNLLATIAILWT